MSLNEKIKISVTTRVNADVKKIWDVWTKPEHIVNWNFAAEEWACPTAENQLQTGGNFNYRMEAKDGSFGFDFKGTYDLVNLHNTIEYTLEDGRQVAILFKEENGATLIEETFDAESENSIELQKSGWKAILENFKRYAESL